MPRSDDTASGSGSFASGPVPNESTVSPHAALERRLAAAPGGELEVLASRRPGIDDGAVLDDAFSELSALLDQWVGTLSADEWGAPAFFGTVEDETFPLWSDALVLAAWWRDDKVAFLALRHEDDADPLTVEAGAYARGELDELEAWRPDREDAAREDAAPR